MNIPVEKSTVRYIRLSTNENIIAIADYDQENDYISVIYPFLLSYDKTNTKISYDLWEPVYYVDKSKITIIKSHVLMLSLPGAELYEHYCKIVTKYDENVSSILENTYNEKS